MDQEKRSQNGKPRIIEEGWTLKKELEYLRKYHAEKFKLLELKLSPQILSAALNGINSPTWVIKTVKTMEDTIEFDFRSKLVIRAANLLKRYPKDENSTYFMKNKLIALKSIKGFDHIIEILDINESSLSFISNKMYGAPKKTHLHNVISKKQFTNFETIKKLVILAAYKLCGEGLPQLVPIRERSSEYKKTNEKQRQDRKRNTATTPDKKPPKHQEIIENTNGFKLVEKTNTSVDNQKLFSNFDAGSKALIALYLSSGVDSTIIDPFKRMDLVLRLLEALKFDSGTFKGITETIAGEQVDYQPDSLLTLNHLLDFNGGGN